MFTEVIILIYTVTFNPAIDYVMHTSELRTGAVVRSELEEIYFGGKGINVSVVLNELGIKSRALGFTAGFTGAAIEQGLRGMGIDCDFIRLADGFSRINVKIKAQDETDLNGQGPDIDAVSLDKLFGKLGALNEGDTVVLAGSVPKCLPADIYEKAARELGDTARCEEDVLSYISFPQVAENFFAKRREAEEKKVRYSIVPLG